MVICWLNLPKTGLISLFSSVVFILLLPQGLHAQTKGKTPKGPVSPTNTVPVRIVNYPQPNRYGIRAGNIVTSFLQDLLNEWPSILSASYQFSNQRSRVGGTSLDSQSAIADFAELENAAYFTSVDIAYAYSYASGSSPTGMSETIDQHVGSLRLLQPLEPIYDKLTNADPNHSWKPATQT